MEVQDIEIVKISALRFMINVFMWTIAGVVQTKRQSKGGFWTFHLC